MPENLSIHDLAAAVAPPAEGILSRTLHADAQVKVVALSFAEGEELSEHSAAMPAILHVIRGTAHLGLGDASMTAAEGFWVHMPAGLVHSVRALEPSVVLLTLLKAGSA